MDQTERLAVNSLFDARITDKKDFTTIKDVFEGRDKSSDSVKRYRWLALLGDSVLRLVLTEKLEPSKSYPNQVYKISLMVSNDSLAQAYMNLGLDRIFGRKRLAFPTKADNSSLGTLVEALIGLTYHHLGYQAAQHIIACLNLEAS